MSESATILTRGNQLETDPAHILIVDDDERIRRLVQRFLAQNGFRVTTACDAADAGAKMKGLEFDLLVLDVMMPGISGVAFARDVRTTSTVPILMLTARAEPQDRLDGLETGADDYLTKPFEPRELVLRIRSILRRANAAPPKHAEIRMGPCRFSEERGELVREGKPVRLTASEVTLLKVLARRAGQPVGRLELAGLTGAGLERSVDVQVNRLRRKIEADPKMPVYLQTVRGVGYVLLPD
jgi:two-component system phosphate regulon response regulator OmpR